MPEHDKKARTATSDKEMRELIIADIKEVSETHNKSVPARDFYRSRGKYGKVAYKYYSTHQELLLDAGMKRLTMSSKALTADKRCAEASWLREYADIQLLPYHNKYWKVRSKRKTKVVITASDFHCIEADPFPVRVFLDTCRLMQPDDIVLNGDIVDMYGFAKYPKDSRRIRWKKSKQWLDKLLSTLRAICPNSNIIYVIGNHEYRVFKWHADRSPETMAYLQEFCGLTVNQLFGIDQHEVDFICKADLATYTAKAERHELQQNYKHLYDCYYIMHEPDNKVTCSGTNGHLHQNELKSFTVMEPGDIVKECTWMQTGAMRFKDADYVQRFPGWSQGFGITHIDTRTNEVQQLPTHIQHSFACVNGKEYFRKASERPRF